MINCITIDGFKRFEHQSLELRKLTVLAGRNGAGKTSLIHAMLLANHANQRGDGIAQLNGPFGIELGWFADLVNVNREDETPSFYVELRSNERASARWTFRRGDTDLYAEVDVPAAPPALFSTARARGFQYLSAERNGPRLTQRSAALPALMLEVGPTGAHVAQVLEKLIAFPVDERRLARSDARGPALLKAQTEFWLSSIVRPTALDTAELVGTDVIALRFRAPDGEWVRPTNMGFGVSYALPIIVAALTAEPGGMLIVENPEAHLHPAGQSEMGAFLAQMAYAGLQVIVETHSDHVLSGMRLAIAGGGSVDAANAVVHYFADSKAEVEPLEFTATGGISKWPSGFFDQYRLDVAKLTRVPRAAK